MRKAIINLDWLDENIAEYKRVLNEDLVGSELGSIYNHILNAFVLVRSKCEPIEEDINFSSEYHPVILLKTLATSNGNYIKLLCSDMIRHWNSHYGESTMEKIKHRAFGKGYKITFITGGWSGNEDLVNAIKINPISQLCYIKWESGGLHEFFINPNSFGYYTQSDLARKLGVSRQYINRNKDDYEIMKICGVEYLKEKY